MSLLNRVMVRLMLINYFQIFTIKGYIIAGLQLLGCIIGLIVFSILILMETAQSIRRGSCKDCPPLDIGKACVLRWSTSI